MASIISFLGTSQIAGLNTRTISLLTTEDWQAFNSDQIQALTTAHKACESVLSRLPKEVHP